VIYSLIFAAASFLQPSNLEGCDSYPRPQCAMPDIPELAWEPEHRRYVYPVEANGFSRITRHSNPDVYGPDPFPDPGICIINEQANTADCYSFWEISAVAYCHTERWSWVGFGLESNNFFYEHPVLYFEHRSKMRVLFWEYKNRPAGFPVVYASQPSPITPVFTFGVHIDRIQNIRQSDFIGSATLISYLIQESDTTPLFKNVFEWFPGSGGNFVYGGGTGVVPSNDTTPSACVSQVVLGDFCGVNPRRPECNPSE